MLGAATASRESDTRKRLAPTLLTEAASASSGSISRGELQLRQRSISHGFCKRRHHLEHMQQRKAVADRIVIAAGQALPPIITMVARIVADIGGVRFHGVDPLDLARPGAGNLPGLLCVRVQPCELALE